MKNQKKRIKCANLEKIEKNKVKDGAGVSLC